jgi:hypothetical protein
MELNAAEGEIALVKEDLTIAGDLDEQRLLAALEDLLNILAFAAV